MTQPSSTRRHALTRRHARMLAHHTLSHGRHMACTQLTFFPCAFTIIGPPSSTAGNGRSASLSSTEVRWALCMFRTCARERMFVILHMLALGQRHRQGAKDPHKYSTFAYTVALMYGE